MHRVTPELDAGGILARETRPLDPAQSVLRATVSLYARGAELLVGALDAICAGSPGTPQAGEASYDSWPTAAQVREAVRRGVRLVF